MDTVSSNPGRINDINNAKPLNFESRIGVQILSMELSESAYSTGPTLTGPRDAARVLCEHIGDKDREHFAVLHLNTKNRIVSIETISIGTLNASLIHPREIFKGAILANAAAIICGHNHPSGDLEASSEDRQSFERLQKASVIIGIQVLDFLIVARNRYARVVTNSTASEMGSV